VLLCGFNRTRKKYFLILVTCCLGIKLDCDIGVNGSLKEQLKVINEGYYDMWALNFLPDYDA
jgi:hypothetical protein